MTCDSLERIHGYVRIEQEPKATNSGIPPAYWPASGDIRVENLSSRYSLDGQKVLHNLSFHIKSGERIGVGEWNRLISPRPWVLMFDAKWEELVPEK